MPALLLELPPPDFEAPPDFEPPPLCLRTLLRLPLPPATTNISSKVSTLM